MEEWVQVKPSSGSGDGEVTVTLQENNTEEDRSTQITIQGVSLQQVIQILQKGNDMNHYKIQQLNDVYELYKFNPSTGEETLLSTQEEYTTAINELLALKAWLYLSQKTSNSIPDQWIASCCENYTSSSLLTGIKGLFASSSSFPDGEASSSLSRIVVYFGVNRSGGIYKPNLSSESNYSSRLHHYRIMLGENQVSGGEYPLEDIPVENIIDGKTDQEVTYPFSFNSNAIEYKIFELYSGNIKVSNSLSESPYTNLSLDSVPLQVSTRVSYNGNNPRTTISGIINSDLFDGPQKIEAILNYYQIQSVSELKFTISPLIPSSTETV